MKIITPGHKYELENFEKISEASQQIQFIEKQQSPDGIFDTVTDGTTNEEVLAMLIDRMEFLQKKVPCRENALAITNLEQALMWLEKRTANRIKRGVEGTPAA